MEFGNHYYYEITVRQRHRDLLQEVESSGLLKQADLLPKERIGRPMARLNRQWQGLTRWIGHLV